MELAYRVELIRKRLIEIVDSGVDLDRARTVVADLDRLVCAFLGEDDLSYPEDGGRASLQRNLQV